MLEFGSTFNPSRGPEEWIPIQLKDVVRAYFYPATCFHVQKSLMLGRTLTSGTRHESLA